MVMIATLADKTQFIDVLKGSCWATGEGQPSWLAGTFPFSWHELKQAQASEAVVVPFP